MSTAKADLTTEERARRRARFYLLEKYERQLEEAGLAAIATVARGYVPSGYTRPVDVAEIESTQSTHPSARVPRQLQHRMTTWIARQPLTVRPQEVLSRLLSQDRLRRLLVT